MLIGDFLGSELLAAAFEVGFNVGLMHLLLGLGVAVLGGRFLHPRQARAGSPTSRATQAVTPFSVLQGSGS